MPQTREQIKRAPSIDSHVSPHFGDGGWHGSSFASEKFDALWQPRNDRILVRRLPDPCWTILIPPEGISRFQQNRVEIVSVGPGKWIEGCWWKFQTPKPHWEWVPGYRKQMTVRPGMQVVIGPHTDWDSYSGEYALCQEADVRVIL